MNALFCLEPIDLVMEDKHYSVPRGMGEGWRFVDQNAAIRQLKKYEVRLIEVACISGVDVNTCCRGTHYAAVRA